MTKRPRSKPPKRVAVGAEMCWRIIEYAGHGRQRGKVMKTLFHGVRGNRVLPTGRWLQSEAKPVSDGGTVYTSGWHVLRSRQDCQVYLDRFTKPRDLRIIPVLAAGLRPKSHSRHPVLLAEWMLIPDAVGDELTAESSLASESDTN